MTFVHSNDYQTPEGIRYPISSRNFYGSMGCGEKGVGLVRVEYLELRIKGLEF